MYSEVKKIYDSTRFDVFGMVVAYLMDIGYQAAKEITDEDIESCEGNGFMTAEFQQYLMKLARDIANAGKPSELVILCQAESVYDVFCTAGKVQRDRLETFLFNAVGYMMENGMDTNEIMDYICADEEEMIALGLMEEEDEN